MTTYLFIRFYLTRQGIYSRRSSVVFTKENNHKSNTNRKLNFDWNLLWCERKRSFDPPVFLPSYSQQAVFLSVTLKTRFLQITVGLKKVFVAIFLVIVDIVCNNFWSSQATLITNILSWVTDLNSNWIEKVIVFIIWLAIA